MILSETIVQKLSSFTLTGDVHIEKENPQRLRYIMTCVFLNKTIKKLIDTTGFLICNTYKK